MTRHSIQLRTIDEMRREYPIEGHIDGWFFRIRETSNNAWLVEGLDVWGRKVSRDGGDPAALLAECVNDARSVVKRTGNT